MSNLMPLGVYDLLPDSAYLRKDLIDKFTKVVENAHYQYVETPAIEYLSSLEKGLSTAQKRHLLKFFDGQGNTLVMRPDLTTPMARMVASQMKHKSLPLRLYLKNTIFSNPQTSSRETEQFQCGIELLGDGSVTADAEIILLLTQVLKAFGINQYQVDVGHVSLASKLSDDVRNAMLAGNYIETGEIPARGDVSVVQDISELVALDELVKSDPNIVYNRGLIKSLGYYTGIIFQVSIPRLGKEVASGGRYDRMLGTFGYDIPACGFGLDLGLIQAYLGGNHE